MRPQPTRPRPPAGGRIQLVVILGALIGLAIAVTHITGNVQFGGAQGIVVPSWAVITLAPIAVVAMWAWRTESRARYIKRMEAWQRAQQT